MSEPLKRGDIVAVDTETIKEYIDLGVVTEVIDDRDKATVEDLLREFWRKNYNICKLVKVGELELVKIKQMQMRGTYWYTDEVENTKVDLYDY